MQSSFEESRQEEIVVLREKIQGRLRLLLPLEIQNQVKDEDGLLRNLESSSKLPKKMIEEYRKILESQEPSSIRLFRYEIYLLELPKYEERGKSER